MSTLNIQNINIQVLTKLCVNLLQNTKILFKDILTFLALDYIDALLIILYLIVIRISTPKIRLID